MHCQTPLWFLQPTIQPLPSRLHLLSRGQLAQSAHQPARKKEGNCVGGVEEEFIWGRFLTLKPPVNPKTLNLEFLRPQEGFTLKLTLLRFSQGHEEGTCLRS